MSCPATARRPMSSRGGDKALVGHETVVKAAFDKLETALIEEAMSPSNSSSSNESEDAPADLGNDACSSAASAMLPKMEEDASAMNSACEAEDGEAEDAASSNLDALSAEVK